MAKVTEEQVRKELLEQLESKPGIGTTDLFYEIDYKLRVGFTFIQRVMYTMMGEGTLRVDSEFCLVAI